MKIVTRATAIKNNIHMRCGEYIPSEQHWKDMYAQYPAIYRVIEKFPIGKIQRSKLRNEIDMNEVLHMLTNFYQEAWAPITIDENSYLVDGQHRLAVAAQLCMRYIDVIVCLDNK